MSVTQPQPTAPRGKNDAKRHRAKQREIIKKKLPDIISEESIITKRKGKKVKVPIRGVQIPDLRPGRRNRDDEDGDGDGDGQQGGGVGVGQGSGKPGDIISRRPAQGQGQPGQAGEEPGEDYIETEIDIEEIIEMMFDDLGLPNLEEKEVAELEVVLGHTLKGITKGGPWPLLNKKRTGKESLGRFYAFLQVLQDETGRNELECYTALKEADGNLYDAMELLQDPQFSANEDEVIPFPIVHEQDLRFHDIREKVEHESNAVIIAMMDVSGSMSVLKKYYARSMLFWLTELLRKLYDNVDIRFIIHHSTAKIVDEHTFFHTGESGGTRCFTAYETARDLIETQYPTDRWNVYCFHFSDGDDFYPDRSVEVVRKLIEEDKINMFGYGEIDPGDSIFARESALLPAFEEAFPVDMQEEGELLVLSGSANFPFVGVVIEEKEDIWLGVQEYLKKGRWS